MRRFIFNPKNTRLLSYCVTFLLLFCRSTLAQSFSFTVTSDQRKYAGPGKYDTPAYYRGAIEALGSVGAGAFMVVIGDMDPIQRTEWTIDQVLGTDYIWYPVVGNHELPGQGNEYYYGSNMDYLRTMNTNGNTLPYIVNSGPSGAVETNYSFDYGNCHFIIINEYFDGTSDVGTVGDVVDELYDWVAADLAATTVHHKFVLGHEPAFPQPDVDTGRIRHEEDCLNEFPENRDRFWELLVDEGVLAYICGHSHNYSLYNHRGVWQIESGHSFGLADPGAPSTFIKFIIDGGEVTYAAHRDDSDGGLYRLKYSGSLTSLGDSIAIVPTGSVWSYLDNGSDQGTVWREVNFNDRSWASGAAELGYGDGDETTIVGYGPDDHNKYITTYFRHTFDVQDTGVYTSLSLNVLRDDGVIVYLNGDEIYRTNMPDDSVDFQTFSLYAVTNLEEKQFFTEMADPSLLLTGRNVLAVELHQCNLGSSDISFDLSLDGFVGSPPITMIYGQLYLDFNYNGFRDADDEGLNGINVIVSDSQGPQSIITNSNGDWSAFVAPGTVIVDIDESDPDFPAGATQIEGEDPTTLFVVEGDSLYGGADGYYVRFRSTIGDFVWNDINYNGLQDQGEGGIEGVRVTLFSRMTQIRSPLITDTRGRYEFTGLDSGTYSVQFSPQLENSMFTVHDANNNNIDAKDSDVNKSGTTDAFILGPNETKTDIDAGIYSKVLPTSAQASGFIWKDSNLNGIFDEEEQYIRFVTVNLLSSDTLTIEAVTVADSNGIYTFSDIIPRDHIIQVINPEPSIYTFSPKNAGDDDNLDSDVNVNGYTDILTFVKGEIKNYIDAGLMVEDSLTGIENLSSSSRLPKEYALSQNFPNPFNPVTTIRYEIPTPVHVHLSMYNMLGQRVDDLVDEFKNLGFYEVHWDITNLKDRMVPAGIYVYSIQAGSFKKTRKMVLLK